MCLAREQTLMCLLPCTAERECAHSRSTCVSTRERGVCTLRGELRTCLLWRWACVDLDYTSSIRAAAALQTLCCLFPVGGCWRCHRENQDRTRQQGQQPWMAPGQSGDQATAQERKGSKNEEFPWILPSQQFGDMTVFNGRAQRQPFSHVSVGWPSLRMMARRWGSWSPQTSSHRNSSGMGRWKPLKPRWRMPWKVGLPPKYIYWSTNLT